MRTSRLLVFLLAGLLSGSCRGQNKEGEHKPTKDPVVYKGVLDKSCAVEMQYGSYGSGIDSEAYQKTMNLIGKYNVNYSTKNIGREGETRICMPLTELGRKSKRTFIDSLKKIARGGQLVSVSIR